MKSKWFVRTVSLLALFAVGYGAYRVAAHNSWIIVTRGGRSIEVGVEPQRTGSREHLSLLIVGDTGKNTQRRAQVVQAMRKHAAWSAPDAAVLLGDNFYERGVKSIDDPRFRTDFEDLFEAKSFGFPFYVCLGNHDHRGNVDAQVQYTARSERWKMPQRYFRVGQKVGLANVDLFVIDTIPIDQGEDTAAEQLAWLQQELAGSTASWKIVCGHHPLTGGRHEVSDRIAEVLPPLFEAHGVDVYLSGHDHDLQLCDSGRGWLQIVSGAGSKLRSTSWIDETLFAKATPGFCWLRIEESQMSITFYSTISRLFTHTIRQAASQSIANVAPH